MTSRSGAADISAEVQGCRGRSKTSSVRSPRTRFSRAFGLAPQGERVGAVASHRARVEGRVTVPTAPGLGVELDRDAPSPRAAEIAENINRLEPGRPLANVVRPGTTAAA
ncbi:hypothetical protein [Streptomyces sp. NPDC046925]|uniref:hypothetical protein n=1 Tax=Streptomyces sp. NPDC046925 TaxID=3155375 RepID=UPI0033D983F2